MSKAPIKSEAKSKSLSVKDIQSFKNSDEPMVCLTAYSYPMAQLADKHADLILVGDSLGMVLYGFDSTLPVTVDMMVNHGKAVTKGAQRAFVVVDMPFGSYQKSPEQAFENAAKIMAETGCSAVKIEGGVEMAETVSFLVQRGIPVIGHIGLQPQSVNIEGGYKVVGKTAESWKKVKNDAIALQDAGATAVVLECLDEELATEITEQIAIPTIGIGASAACDGQILVTEDMLGCHIGPLPRFVKRYSGVADVIDGALHDYAAEVRARSFPAEAHIYSTKKQLTSKAKG